MFNPCNVGIFIILATLSGVSGCKKIDYPRGKDTLNLFGNGRFQLNRAARTTILTDRKLRETVVYDVQEWCRSGPRIYLIDQNDDYTVVNYLTGEISRYADRTKIPSNYQEGFKSMGVLFGEE